MASDIYRFTLELERYQLSIDFTCLDIYKIKPQELKVLGELWNETGLDDGIRQFVLDYSIPMDTPITYEGGLSFDGTVWNSDNVRKCLL